MGGRRGGSARSLALGVPWRPWGILGAPKPVSGSWSEHSEPQVQEGRLCWQGGTPPAPPRPLCVQRVPFSVEGSPHLTSFPCFLFPELPGAPTNLGISNIGPRSVTLQFRPGYDGKTSISRWLVEAQVKPAGGESSSPGSLLLRTDLMCIYACMNFHMQLQMVKSRMPTVPKTVSTSTSCVYLYTHTHTRQ